MKKMAVVCFSYLSKDPRVHRQLDFLRGLYDVTAFGFDDPKMTNVKFIQLTPQKKTFLEKLKRAFWLILRLYEKNYWKNALIQETKQALSKCSFDAIVANDLDALPVSLSIDPKIKIIFDAHEYAPREFEDRLIWRIFFKKYNYYLSSKYIPKANYCFTVCEGIAKEYQKQFNVSFDIISNAPHFVDIGIKKSKSSKIKLICHSAAIPSRKN